MKRRKRVNAEHLRELMGILIAYILDVGKRTKGGRLTVSYPRLKKWARKRGVERKLKRGVPWRDEFIKIFKDAVVDMSRHPTTFLLDREKALKIAEELLREFPEAKELLFSEVAVKR